MRPVAGSSRLRRVTVILLLVLFVGLGAVAAVVVQSLTSSGRQPFKLPEPRCSAQPGSYRVKGAKILASDGKSFEPFGITVLGLAYKTWKQTLGADEAQINAIATAWHANTVRLQVAPTYLFDKSPLDSEYLTALESVVCRATRAGLNVVISAQYQATSDIPMADASTMSFWSTIAAIYANDQHVWFDLFNEPRLFVGSRLLQIDTPAQQWGLWRNGGQGYVGMQALLDTVRTKAPSNIVLAEGTEGGESLTYLPAFMLSGRNVVYAVHPYFNPPFSTPADWSANWGDLASSVAIVVGEWGEYRSTRNECVTDAPTLVPRFLQYLAVRHIGLIAWALRPGVLLRGTSLTEPTSFLPGSIVMTCSGSPEPADIEGIGALVRTYFAKHDAGAR
jgi:hypothetical protein